MGRTVLQSGGSLNSRSACPDDVLLVCCLAGRVYLDYAGAAPVSQSQLKAAFSALSSTLFTNPRESGGRTVVFV